ncbi:MAG: NERD domain-containing protein [Bacteroidetes bacterium]|nr:NERD domain-containing protein [Bacteroidota bacterium]
MNEETLTILLFGIIAFFALLLKYLKPIIKGKVGEAKVSWKLKRLSSRKYKVINNLLIGNKSRSSQTDHILISSYGIFVIETKHYKGWIFGHENSDTWSQTLYNKKYTFRNPILQNWGHINTLKTLLFEFPHVPYFPIIVFSGKAKLKKITSKVPVITRNKLIRTIKKNSTSEYLSKEEVNQIYQKLVRLKSARKVTKRSHVRKAKTTARRSEKSRTCPRCGGRLILKDGKYGMFYGCSSFPNCKYTKDYKK